MWGQFVIMTVLGRGRSLAGGQPSRRVVLPLLLVSGVRVVFPWRRRLLSHWISVSYFRTPIA